MEFSIIIRFIILRNKKKNIGNYRSKIYIKMKSMLNILCFSVNLIIKLKSEYFYKCNHIEIYLKIG